MRRPLSRPGSPGFAEVVTLPKRRLSHGGRGPTPPAAARRSPLSAAVRLALLRSWGTLRGNGHSRIRGPFFHSGSFRIKG